MANEMPVANKCEFCGRDCSFLAMCDGCCVPCGDAFQTQFTGSNFVEHIRADVKVFRALRKFIGLAKDVVEVIKESDPMPDERRLMEKAKTLLKEYSL